MFSRKVKDAVYRIMIFIYGKTHRIEKKVLFSSFGGQQYSDNPRAISEKMHELYPDYEIVWLFKELSPIERNVPDYVRKVKTTRKSIIKEKATACCIVSNEDFKGDMYKNKKQFVIQTWHGDRGFKKVLYDIPQEKLPKGFVVTDNKWTDLCIAASDYGVWQYRNAFHYEGEIMKRGMPRNDKLVIRDLEREKDTKEKLGLLNNEKVLIFAPTFRDSQADRQIPTVDLLSTLCVLEEKGEKWVCLVRAHSSSAGISLGFDSNKFIDVTNYPDMADLLAIGDLLITDYSSCAGDFILTGKGAILAVFDKEEYESGCRELTFDISEAGYIAANNQNELENIIRSYSEEDYKKNKEQICRYFNIVETGRSSEEICMKIDEYYNQNRT